MGFTSKTLLLYGENAIYCRRKIIDSVKDGTLNEDALNKCVREVLKLIFANNQLELINAIANTGKRVAVVLFGGSVVALPFNDKVSAILNVFLHGQNGGTAVYKLLYGEVNPSGRLSETWVQNISDVPFMDTYSITPLEVYRESVFVGYKYHVSADTRVAYSFGHGLSYTTFDYNDYRVERVGDKVTVSCNVTNSGEVYGGEVVQLYVGFKGDRVFRPIRELIAYDKIYLDSKENKRVIFELPISELAYYDVKLSKWVVSEGDYNFSLCRNAETVICTDNLFIEGENTSPYDEDTLKTYSTFPLVVDDEAFTKISGLVVPPETPKKPFTVETRIEDFKEGRMGKIINKMLMSVPKKKTQKGKKTTVRQKS